MLTLTKRYAIGLTVCLMSQAVLAEVVKNEAAASTEKQSARATSIQATDAVDSATKYQRHLVRDGGFHVRIVTRGQKATVVVREVPPGSQSLDRDRHLRGRINHGVSTGKVTVNASGFGARASAAIGSTPSGRLPANSRIRVETHDIFVFASGVNAESTVRVGAVGDRTFNGIIVEK